MFSSYNTILFKGVRGGVLKDDFAFNTKFLEGNLDNLWGIIDIKDFTSGGILGIEFE